jgi:hypothetical protein
MAPRASSLFGRRDVGFETLPFGITEIGRVAPFHGSERKPSTSPSLFQTVSTETVWKIAEGVSTALLWRQERPIGTPFDPSWPLSEPRFRTHSEFPNSFSTLLGE